MIALKSEYEIINDWKGEKDKPKISICCITYNHEEYISDALDGFLTQKTSFSYEILIHDDASTDRTAEIIKKYHEKYPNLIKPIYQTENQFSKGGIHPNLEFNYPRARGDYIALCDGDDYWSDPQKLEKQVSFLEKNKNFIGTAHNVEVIDENRRLVDSRFHPYKKYSTHVFTIKDAEQFKLAGQTSSVLYRNIWKDIDENILKHFKLCKTTGDKKLALLLALQGDIYCFADVMAIHRKITSHGSSWSASAFGKNMALKRYKELIEVSNFAYKSFGKELNNKKQRLNSFYGAIVYFIKNPNRENWMIIKQIIDLGYDKKHELLLNALYNIINWPIRTLIRRFNNGK